VLEVQGPTDTRGIGNMLNEPRWTAMPNPLLELVYLCGPGIFLTDGLVPRLGGTRTKRLGG
jgi:hypothetical protein